MKIIDAFIFYNELDILYYRLSTLNDTVDYFILVESNLTHKGTEKPLFFNIHKDTQRFAKFSHKIIHIIETGLEPFPIVDEKDLTSPQNRYWKNENKQRNAIDKGIQQLNGGMNGGTISPEDILLISDVDEIPNRLILEQLKSAVSVTDVMGEYGIISLRQDFYYYNLLCKNEEEWIFPKMMTLKFYTEYLDRTPQRGRMYHTEPSETSQPTAIMENGGWHLSYFGDPHFIQNKIRGFAHQEFNTAKYTNINYIQESIKNKKSIYDRSFDKITYIPISSNDRLPFEYNTYLHKFTTENTADTLP